jgi:type I restriction enzyme S subunit
MSGFRPSKLGEYLRVEHGFAFKGEHFSDNGRHIVLTPGNFHEEGGFRPRPGKDRYYQSSFPPRYLLKKNAVIVAMTEQGEGLLGSAAIVPEGDTFLHNQRIGLVRAKEGVADAKFLYYLFNTSSVRQQIRNSSAGTKIRHTSPERIYGTDVFVPDVAIQQKIAAILSAYDDLIANNQRRITLLERMAEDIYREWFVRLRFPGHENVKIEKGVPQGWGFVALSEIASINASSLKKGSRTDRIQYIDIRDGLNNSPPVRVSGR